MYVLSRIQRLHLRQHRCTGSKALAGASNLRPRVLLPVAQGTEEIEAVTILDVLSRAGADVVLVASAPSLQVTCSRGLRIQAHQLTTQCNLQDQWDLIVCPGGMPAASTLSSDRKLMYIMMKQHKEQKLIAAISSAPTIVLNSIGILENRHATCYPLLSFIDCIRKDLYCTDEVVTDGHIITSPGPGTVMAFSILLVEKLFGAGRSEVIADELLFNKAQSHAQSSW